MWQLTLIWCDNACIASIFNYINIINYILAVMYCNFEKKKNVIFVRRTQILLYHLVFFITIHRGWKFC